jgi:energy-coupling factor transporter ATP-binding protein EcfA2
MSRTFEYGPAIRATLPLLIGVAGPTGSGKTFSALRLATGMQRVTGGDIALIDTEAKRATAYDGYFKFNHLDFAPPFGPLDYRDAIDFVLSKGAKNVIIDSMTHEHSGQGGVLDQIEKFLEQKAGDNYREREKYNMLAHKKPKKDRKELNDFIIQAGRNGVNFIFCYRADEKVKPVKGEGIQNIGMTPETTSKLVYEMMAMFLLSAAADGKPITNPATPLEKIFTKLPVQFRDMIAAGEPLSEDFGQKLAEWAKGSPNAPEHKAHAARPVDELTAAGDSICLDGTAKLEHWWLNTLSKEERVLLKSRIAGWKEIAARAKVSEPKQSDLGV